MGSKVFVYVVALVLAIGFQNCSDSTGPGVTVKSVSRNVDNGNENGYGGKPYVRFKQCSDGTKIGTQLRVFEKENRAQAEIVDCIKLGSPAAIGMLDLAMETLNLGVVKKDSLMMGGKRYVHVSDPEKFNSMSQMPAEVTCKLTTALEEEVRIWITTNLAGTMRAYVRYARFDTGVDSMNPIVASLETTNQIQYQGFDGNSSLSLSFERIVNGVGTVSPGTMLVFGGNAVLVDGTCDLMHIEDFGS